MLNFDILFSNRLTAPSVVLAEATWYGSFRAGIDSRNNNPNETTLGSFGSRWGVKGSNEISDGLSGVYRYEEALDLRNATLSGGNRLSYVGLSGGFGTLTMGRIWGAAYNHYGSITDNSYWVGPSANVGTRIGPAVSYATSAGSLSMQVDAIMERQDGEVNSKTVDQLMFGASMDFGAGKAGLAYHSNSFGTTTKTVKVTKTGLAAQTSFGNTRIYLGGVQTKTEGVAQKSTIYHMGGGTSLGDTGVSALLQIARRKDATGKPTPVMLGLYKSLGGSSTVVFEALTNDKDNNRAKTKSSAVLFLKVDF